MKDIAFPSKAFRANTTPFSDRSSRDRLQEIRRQPAMPGVETVMRSRLLHDDFDRRPGLCPERFVTSGSRAPSVESTLALVLFLLTDLRFQERHDLRQRAALEAALGAMDDGVIRHRAMDLEGAGAALGTAQYRLVFVRLHASIRDNPTKECAHANDKIVRIFKKTPRPIVSRHRREGGERPNGLIGLVLPPRRAGPPGRDHAFRPEPLSYC
jgi:hypothetical protein